MPICPICDDTGLINSDSTAPEFCYCAAGKKARRQWQSAQPGGNAVKAPSFIDIANLEQVNASVDAMRASLLGNNNEISTAPAKHAAVQLLYHVGHPGHEVTASEATQLYDLAKALEGFLGGLGAISRNSRR
ncbi:MAG TPA: hypothetical protein VL485_23290 [Ktedonobacteraceae bacterium]|jgi:hypothetical protein|nr:hypothetical protein [Ktedonobacteraceae bacterium]